MDDSIWDWIKMNSHNVGDGDIQTKAGRYVNAIHPNMLDVDIHDIEASDFNF